PPLACSPVTTPSSFSLILPPPPRATLFPYTTLFRSRLVVADLDTLGTLAPVQIAAGMSEAIKHAVIGDADYFAFLEREQTAIAADRKSTRLNSSHDQISYAVFCLKKKKQKKTTNTQP